LTRGATQKQSKKRGPGAPKGNKNAKRPKLSWPKKYTLETRENLASFLRYLARIVLEDKLGERSAGSINNTMRLLGDVMGWITKAPLQIIQAQIMPAPGMITEKEVQELLEALPLEHQLDVWKKFKERRGLRPNIPSGSTG
jgi:hypothetical protein